MFVCLLVGWFAVCLMIYSCNICNDMIIAKCVIYCHIYIYIYIYIERGIYIYSGIYVRLMT